MAKAHTSLGHGVNGSSNGDKHIVLRLDEIDFDPSFNSRISVGAEAETTNDKSAEWSTFVESFDVNAHVDGEAYTLADPKLPVFSSKDGEPVVNGSPTRPFSGIKQDTDIVVRPNTRKGSRKAFSAVDGFRRDLAIRSVYRMYGVPVKDQTVRAKVQELSDLDAIAENVRANQARRSLTDKELTLATSRYCEALNQAGYVAHDRKGAIPAGIKAYTANFIATKLGISRSYAQIHMTNARELNSQGGAASESMRHALRTAAVDIPVRTIELAAKATNQLVKDGKVSADAAGDKLIELARATDTVQRSETRKAAREGDVSAKWKAWADAAKSRGHRLGIDEADGLCQVKGGALTDPDMAKVWANVTVKDDIAIVDSATDDSRMTVVKAASEGYRAGMALAKENQAKRAKAAASQAQPSSGAPSSTTAKKGKGKKGSKSDNASAN